MKSKTKIKNRRIVIGLVLAIICLAGLVYVGLKNNIFADTNTSSQYSFINDGASTQVTKQSDCDDGLDITQDILNNNTNTGMYCTHKILKPVIVCDVDLNHQEEWVRSGALDTCNVFSMQEYRIKGFKDKYKSSLDGKLTLVKESFSWNMDYSVACRANPTTYQLPGSKDACVEEILAKIEKDISTNNLMFDELHTGAANTKDSSTTIEQESALSIALHRFKSKHPEKLLFVAAPSSIPADSVNKESLARGIVYSDYFMPEFYYPNTKWYYDGNRSIAGTSGNPGLIEKGLDEYIAFASSAKGKMVPIISISDGYEEGSLDLNPNANYSKFLESQVYLLKLAYNQAKTAGISFYTFSRASFQTKGWVVRIVDNLFIKNQNTTISSPVSDINNWFANNYIQNSSFEDALDVSKNWRATSSIDGRVQVGDLPEWVEKSGNIPDYTESKAISTKPYTDIRYHVLMLKRGSGANVVSQSIKNLNPAKTYEVTVYSKKYSGDYGTSGIKTSIIDQSGASVAYNYLQKQIYNNTHAFEYPCTNELPTCAKNSDYYRGFLWMKETMLFTPPGGQLQIKIEDSSAKTGDESIVDSVRIREQVFVAPAPSPTPSKTAVIAPSPSPVSTTSSPPAPPIPSFYYTFPRGFSTLGVTKSLSTSLITTVDGLYVYGFDGPNNKWLMAPTDSFTLEPSKGYYIYNKLDTKTISLPYDTFATNSYTLTKGWNMLHSTNTKQRSDIKFSFANQQKTIDELTNQNIINPKVFIIDNDQSKDSCTYFSLLDTTDQSSDCSVSSPKKSKSIPSGKAFWVYVK